MHARATSFLSASEPERYLVSVGRPNYPGYEMQAMVEVTRTDAGPTFRVMCMTPKLEPWDGWYKPGFTCPLGAVAPGR